MHRDGQGNVINDLEAAKAEWRTKGRSPSTYCSKKEWEATQEDIGELVLTTPDGTEIRKHASLKNRTRGGSYVIVHNRVIVGNPAKYAEWRTKNENNGWMAEWTYYPHSHLEELIERHTSATT